MFRRSSNIKMKLVSLTISLFNLVIAKALECVSVINEKCMASAKIITTNANEPIFYPLSIKVNKCSGDLQSLLMIQWLNCACLMLLKT